MAKKFKFFALLLKKQCFKKAKFFRKAGFEPAPPIPKTGMLTTTLFPVITVILTDFSKQQSFFFVPPLFCILKKFILSGCFDFYKTFTLNSSCFHFSSKQESLKTNWLYKTFINFQLAHQKYIQIKIHKEPCWFFATVKQNQQGSKGKGKKQGQLFCRKVHKVAFSPRSFIC